MTKQINQQGFSLEYDVHAFPALPAYSIGGDSYQELKRLLAPLGKRVFLLGGEKALRAGLEQVQKALADSDVQLTVRTYTGEPTRSQARQLAEEVLGLGVNVVLGMGGGRALDAAKAVGHYANVPVFTLPTIPATCAAISALSVMYDEDSKDQGPFLFLRHPPVHVLLHTGILAASPAKYLRAGIGDSISKHVESHFKAGDHTELTYEDLLGLSIAGMGYETLMRIGRAAMQDAKAGIDSPVYRLACQCCIITPGLVSILVKEALNGALAHALYYTFKYHHGIADCLHGEVVAWGSLVQLVLEGKAEKALKLKSLLSSLEIPVSLEQMGVTLKEVLPHIREVLAQPDMLSAPYQISEYMVQHALEKTEWLSIRKGG
ncbi:MAG: iron-containing alcohol dehydrogenase [Verrucomicrobiota bacterium]